MNLARHIEKFFLGEDTREAKDAEIALYRSQIAQNSQVVQSGARVITHMSEMMQLIAHDRK